MSRIPIGILALAPLATACFPNESLSSFPHPRLEGTLQTLMLRYDGDDTVAGCKGFYGVTAEEDRQKLGIEWSGGTRDVCAAPGPAETCSTKKACFPPMFALAGTVASTTSSVLTFTDGQSHWRVELDRSGTAELATPPPAGGHLTIGDRVTVHCVHGAAEIVGASFSFDLSGRETVLPSSEVVVAGDDVTFTIGLIAGNFNDGTVKPARVRCDVVLPVTKEEGPSGSRIRGALPGAEVPLLFPVS
jgi:hypothetical protein